MQPARKTIAMQYFICSGGCLIRVAYHNAIILAKNDIDKSLKLKPSTVLVL